MKTPTHAQAVLLCWIFGRDRGIKEVMTEGRDGAPAYLTPTENALLRQNWLEPAEPLVIARNGFKYQKHRISAAGYAALGLYFAKRSKQ